MTDGISHQRLERCYRSAREMLLSSRHPSGHWEGELSTSALSTAVAVMALHTVRRNAITTHPPAAPATTRDAHSFDALIEGGLNWLASHQNTDGGWGDTVLSVSNISTTMLAHAVFHATGTVASHQRTVDAAAEYIDRAGGVAAVLRRYGKDRTFSVPILTHCALAGLVDWNDVIPLPFELACLPPGFYKTVRLPVVSYALPALIAIGQVRHHHRPSRNPLVRAIRNLAKSRSLERLESVQPENGGFLEAAPLTGFVTMSLAAMGLADHPVARKGVAFLVNSVHSDGSWPIDTNLATWVTTLSINALGDDLPAQSRPSLDLWLRDQQYRIVHPYTNADPGGWAWTNLPGGVPDADDSPGALLALLNLAGDDGPFSPELDESLTAGVNWLLDVQNRDGGWPTFCRGWGALPFDKSAPDLTAHAVRALQRWSRLRGTQTANRRLATRAHAAIDRGFAYLRRTQRPEGSWLPLWFGNQFAPDDENPVYGTARVLAAFRDAGNQHDSAAQRGRKWLEAVQNADGGWGGAAGVQSSVEETALACEALCAFDPQGPSAHKALAWLLDSVESGRICQVTPIGFYFAKLWYFERLYPLIFTVSALRGALAAMIPGGQRTNDLISHPRTVAEPRATNAPMFVRDGVSD